ncbi:MAG: CbtB-domain containing protein [Actinomycetota bacterium]|nr:CbtB-domain containing protein [Actinomycetota bacterium]
MELAAEQERARVPAWAWLVVAMATAMAYALTLENGAVLGAGATTLHELVHDGRHFLGVPCH